MNTLRKWANHPFIARTNDKERRSSRRLTHSAYFCLAISFCSAAPAVAEILTTCSSAEGYAYFFEGGLVPKGRGGWTPEKITGGTLLLSLNDKKYQIQYKDAEKWKNVESEGGKIYEIPNPTQGYRVLLVIYETGVVEHFLFRLDPRGTGELLFGTVRPTDLFIAKDALLRYVCRRQ